MEAARGAVVLPEVVPDDADAVPEDDGEAMRLTEVEGLTAEVRLSKSNQLEKGSRTFIWLESGLDCLMCATFAKIWP